MLEVDDRWKNDTDLRELFNRKMAAHKHLNDQACNCDYKLINGKRWKVTVKSSNIVTTVCLTRHTNASLQSYIDQTVFMRFRQFQSKATSFFCIFCIKPFLSICFSRIFTFIRIGRCCFILLMKSVCVWWRPLLLLLLLLLWWLK